jgi:hypothetical protein
VTPQLVLAVMLAMPSFTGDRSETAEQRAELYYPIATAIAEVARSRSEVAILISLSWHETKWARAVVEGRCGEMPAGQRCDGGKARGPWQLHLEACRTAYALPEASAGSIQAEAQCAIRLLRFSAERGKSHTATPWHSAFAGYAARPWDWPGAEARVRTTRRILSSMGNVSK